MIELLTSAAAAALLRWVAFCGASTVVGASCYIVVLPAASSAGGARRLERFVGWSAMALIVSGLGRLLQQALAFAPSPAESWAMVPILLGTPWGYAWIAQLMAAACVVLAPQVVTREGANARQAVLRLVVVLAVAAAPAFQGHAIGSERLTIFAVLADVVHVLAAGTWIGTLAVLTLVALKRVDASEARALIMAFSPWALGSAATLGVTGTFAAWLHVGELPWLWGSPYGRVLLLKLALVAAIMAMGAINWRRLTPRLSQVGGVDRLAMAARVELFFSAATLLATAVLVATPLPGE